MHIYLIVESFKSLMNHSNLNKPNKKKTIEHLHSKLEEITANEKQKPLSIDFFSVAFPQESFECCENVNK